MPVAAAQTNFMTRRRVLIVDDHPLVREGLAKLIEREADLTVCAQAADPNTAYALAASEQPDAAIVDLSLGGDSGFDLIRRLNDLPQPPRILVVSMHDEASHAERAMRAGALGYVMKRETSGQVVSALRRILQGKIAVSDAMSARAAEKFFQGDPAMGASPVATLSERELEIFRRIGNGQETREIAEQLHLSIKTVQTHCAHIKEKLGLSNATLLIREAVRWMERTSPPV
jgi:DNA-binding NarL/FixJ family response regulator